MPLTTFNRGQQDIHRSLDLDPVPSIRILCIEDDVIIAVNTKDSTSLRSITGWSTSALLVSRRPSGPVLLYIAFTTSSAKSAGADRTRISEGHRASQQKSRTPRAGLRRHRSCVRGQVTPHSLRQRTHMQLSPVGAWIENSPPKLCAVLTSVHASHDFLQR